MVQLDYSAFPTTRYQGSKRKITPWLHGIFKELEFNSALDVFGGSGTVSYLFKKMGKTVTYNDIMKFNYFIGKGLIENNSYTINKADLTYLLSCKSSFDEYNFIQETFSGIYYLEEENLWLDSTIRNIKKWNQYSNQEQDFKKYMAYYAIFQSSLVKRPYNLFHRKNLSLRLSDVPRSFGNKTTWDTSFESHFKRYIDESNNCVFDSGRPCKATNSSVFEIDTSEGFDLVYLDPPYLNAAGSNESADYLKHYHFLEGIANYEHWAQLIDFETANLRFKDRANINHFHKNNIDDTYEIIFDKFKKSKIVLSYKDDGSPSIDFFVLLMKKFKKNVHTMSKRYKYALNKKDNTRAKSSEVIIVGY